MQKNLSLSYIEISKNNLIHNFKQFRGLVKKETLIVAVVKANAYGHGDKEAVKILSPYADYFQVNSVEELARIKKNTKKPILVFGYVGKNDLAKAMNLGCILSVFDLPHLFLIDKIAQKLKKKQKVHIAIDSFLGREGIMPNETETFVKNLAKTKNIVLDGIYSHFANIEDIRPDEHLFGQPADFSHAQKQIDAYKNTLEIFKKYGFEKIKTHISATSGIMVHEKNTGKNNIVRIGIGLYGMWPSEYLKDTLTSEINLKPILAWKTHIAQVKILPLGHSIGYGLTYVTQKETRVAIIPQGYADGFSRGLSNKGEVLIGGTKCEVLGRIAMNMFVVNVSHLANIKAEDEVVLLGQQGNEIITAEELADKLDTINYEITTKISPLLPRIAI